VKKHIFYTEMAYLLGTLILALGTAMTERGGFGISMVVAPAYLLHLRLSQLWTWFTFGVAEYLLQAVVLLLLAVLMRRGKIYYLLSFVNTVVYGLVLDGFIRLLAWVPAVGLWQRLALYIPGVLLCCLGISLLFHSYLPPAAYELFVKEIAKRFHKPIHSCKTVYDIVSLTAATVMSFAFFGGIQGIGIGTVACAFTYGIVIRFFSKHLERIWHFRDRFTLRKYFTEREEKQ